MTIVTSPKFAQMTQERLRELREIGADVKGNIEDSAIANLPDATPGEFVVGSLEAGEARIYVELLQVTASFDLAQRNVVVKRMLTVADEVAKGAASDIPNLIASVGNVLLSGDEEMAVEYFRISVRQAHICSLFWFVVHERIGFHDWHLGIRRGGKIVKVARRW